MREQLNEDVVRAYFAALSRGDLSAVPWADDAELRAPVASAGSSAPVRGRTAIIALLAPIVANIAHVEVANILVQGEWAAGRAQISLRRPAGAQLRTMNIFRIRDGLIVEQENHFDPRPALDGMSAGAADPATS